MDDPRPRDLTEYRRKRHADHTPEPFGADVPRSSPAPLFVVQRHSARRLHYDFRLERDGALMSWAVPRGIPLEPGAKHLAVHVEDHPLDYAAFEGDIPAGQYGAGRVEIWDAGTYELLLDKPDGGMSVRLSGRRLRGTWELVPASLGGDEKNWLVIRKREDGAVAMPQERYAPMLASLVDAPPSGDRWRHEVKWDGFRALCRLRSGEAALWSRRDQDLTERFAAVAKRLPRAVRTPDCVLDGEVCALDEDGRPRFELLQKGGGSLVYYVFDVLEVDGERLLGLPWSERRERLEALIEPDDAVVRVSPVFSDGGPLLRAATEQRLEGVIAKRVDSPYRPGGRSGEWRKVKVRRRRELAIAGYRRGQGSRSHLGALILAVPGPGGWEWAGNCGSGLSEADITALLEVLTPLERPTSPFATVPADLRGRDVRIVWTEPRAVCEVEFTEWTAEGRMRAPVYVGLRPGTHAEDVRREDPVGAAGDAAGGDDADPPDVPEPPEPGGNPGPPTDPDPADDDPPAAAPAPSDRVAITRPDKVFFPAEGITKGDLIEYYRAVAPALVPHLRDRPITMMRHPGGLDGKHFVQKDRPPHMPDWIPVAPLPGGTSKNARTIRFPLVNEPDALVWMVNAGCIDHNAWLSRRQHPTRPDFLLFDLDPSGDADFADALRVALLVRDALGLMGLRCYAKTSSARGVHVMAPIAPEHEFGEARELCKVVARALESAHPGLVTTTWAKDERHGVLIDCNQMGYGRTISSVYSVRPRPGAPVSTPLTWDEVEDGVDPTSFTMRAVLDRLERMGDLFAPVLAGDQRIDEALARLR